MGKLPTHTAHSIAFIFCLLATLSRAQDPPAPTFSNVSSSTRLASTIYDAHPRNAGAIDLDGMNQKDIIVTFADAGFSGWDGAPGRAILSDITGGVPRFSRDIFLDLWSGNEPSDGASGLIFADFDNDGDLDFYCPNPLGHQLFQFNQTTGKYDDVTDAMGLNQTWYELPDNHSINAAWGDFDGDTWLDLIVLYGEDHTLGSSYQVIWKNLGGTGFEDASDYHIVDFSVAADVVSAHWADFDQDHDLDLLLVQGLPNSGDQSRFWENTGAPGHILTENTSFRSQFDDLMNEAWNLTALGDFNADGNLDIVYGNQQQLGIIATYPDLSTAVIEEIAHVSGGYPQVWDVDAIDANLDGFCDVAFARQRSGTNDQRSAFYLGRIDEVSGEFAELLLNQHFNDANDPSYARSLCSADFTLDGQTEIYQADRLNEPEDLKFFLDIPNGSQPNWIGIRPRSLNGLCNRFAIGATVVLTTNSSTWEHVEAKIVDGGSGLASQADLDLSFGLGTYNEPVDVAVIVPNGTPSHDGETIHFSNLPLGQYRDLVLDGIFPGSVQHSIEHDVITGSLTLTITWVTGLETSPQSDLVNFHSEGIPDAAGTPQEYYIGGGTVEPRHGVFYHTMVISDLPCNVDFAFYFSVQSEDAGRYFGSSISRAQPDECLGKNTPGIDF